MIERQFVAQKIKEHQIEEHIAKTLSKAGYSHTEIHRTPLGEKITIFTTRPGLVVGKKGDNIRKLTDYLKRKFKLENPQIEIGEVQNPMLDVQYVADRIIYSFERFGSKRFKSIGYKILQDIINAGAIGAEIVLSGKLPSARARTWRFSAGYMKKSGDIAMNKIHKAIKKADLKSGTVGIKVAIMTPDIELPDKFYTIEKKTVEQPPAQQEQPSTSTETTPSVIEEKKADEKEEPKKETKEKKSEPKKKRPVKEKKEDGVNKEK